MEYFKENFLWNTERKSPEEEKRIKKQWIKNDKDYHERFKLLDLRLSKR